MILLALHTCSFPTRALARVRSLWCVVVGNEAPQLDAMTLDDDQSS
jgi:hypothetical protein